MSKTIFYKKVGRRYEPVYEYDSQLLDALPKGNHMISVYPGGKSTRYNINPDYAALIAAGRVAEDAVSQALMKATELRLPREVRERGEPLSPEEMAAWNHLVEVMGEHARRLEWASIRECAEAGVAAMQAEADRLLAHPAARKAYERFLTVCRLVNAGELD